MNVFAIFTQAVKYAKLIPVAIILMRSVEEAIPGDYTPEAGDTRTRGEIKLALFREYLEEFWNGAEESFGDFSKAWPYIERIVARFVKIVFKKDK